MAKKAFIKIGFVSLVLLLGVFSSLTAGEGRLEFVETEVILFPDGKASVEYVVRFNVISGELHGFYFGGFDRLTPHFDYQNASAIDSRGNTYGLEIKKERSDLYDIILAKGRGVSTGYVTYRFRFAADMSKAGYLAPTTAAEDRKLIVFSWAPTQWDESLQHYTVKVIYPIEFVSAQTDRAAVEAALLSRGFATERWMNSEYKIDYRIRKISGKPHIEVLLHKDNAPIKYRFRIQQYVNEDVFPDMVAPTTPSRAYTPSEEREAPSALEEVPPKKGLLEKIKDLPKRWPLIAGLIFMLFSSLFGVSRKHRSMVRAQCH